MDKYAGYLFCGECGQKLYLHRCKSLAPEKNFFQCGGYQTKGGTHCTAHYIREQVLDEIVLRIDVYEKAEKFSRKCGNYIEIHYTFQQKPRTTSKTAVSTIAVLPMELQMATINA